jgi:hypothetical protein
MNYISPDTTPDAHRKQIEILRKMSPEKRAIISLELSDNVRQIAIAGIKKQYPAFTDTQIKRELLRRCYGEELFQKVAAAKGWKE